MTYTSQTYAPEQVIRPCLTANMAIGHPAMCTEGDNDLLYLFVSRFHKGLPQWQNSISSLDSLALNRKLNYLASCIIFLYFYNMTCIRIYSINWKFHLFLLSAWQYSWSCEYCSKQSSWLHEALILDTGLFSLQRSLLICLQMENSIFFILALYFFLKRLFFFHLLSFISSISPSRVQHTIILILLWN